MRGFDSIFPANLPYRCFSLTLFIEWGCAVLTGPKPPPIDPLVKKAVQLVLGWQSTWEDQGFPRWERGKLKGRTEWKIVQLVQGRLITFKADNILIFPIPGYNRKKVPYRMQYDGLRCECTGYIRNQRCSHQTAVIVYRKLLRLEGLGFKLIDDNRVLVNLEGGNHEMELDDDGYATWCSCESYRYSNVVLEKTCKHVNEWNSQRRDNPIKMMEVPPALMEQEGVV